MARIIGLVVFIPDNVREVEILRTGSACYPHGNQGEPDTVEQSLYWALKSEWGREKLTSLGITWATENRTAPPPPLKGQLLNV